MWYFGSIVGKVASFGIMYRIQSSRELPYLPREVLLVLISLARINLPE